MWVHIQKVSAFRYKTCLLKMYCKNVSLVVKHWEFMNLFGEFLWILSLWKKRMNELILITKVAMLSQRVFETCMSLNPKEVVRKWMVAHVYNIQPTQYMLETQVFVCMTCFLLTKSYTLIGFLLYTCAPWWVSFLTNFLSL